MKNYIVLGCLIGGAILLSAAMQIYFSPLQTCVRLISTVVEVDRSAAALNCITEQAVDLSVCATSRNVHIGSSVPSIEGKVRSCHLSLSTASVAARTANHPKPVNLVGVTAHTIVALHGRRHAHPSRRSWSSHIGCGSGTISSPARLADDRRGAA